MIINPAYSPCAPELGCIEIASKPVMLISQSFSSSISDWYPSTCSTGANGWMLENSGHVTAVISVVLFNFIVQEPRGIILVFRLRSLLSNVCI